jgi:hypothetical protein
MDRPPTGGRRLRRAGVRIGAGAAAAALAALGAFQLLHSSAEAGRDATARAAQGTGLDPLTDQEVDKARTAALADQPRAQSARGLPQVVFVSADRVDADSGPRTADVRLYDYRTDELVVRHVDLASGRVVRTEHAKGTQPPPASAELRRAVEMILADSRLGPGLRAAYKAAAGREPASAADIHVRGRIFYGPQAGGASNRNEVAECGRRRCFGVNLKLPDGTWVDTRRIVVNMSAQRINILDR